jgi:hypothetical protein
MCNKWFHCNGWPTQVERMWKTVSLWWVTYPNGKNVKCGLIVMGDLPRWKIEKMWSGLIVMGDLPKRKMMVSLWWVTYPDGKNDGLIVMGDLPRWKMKGGLIMMGDLPRWKMKGGLIIMGDLPKWKMKGGLIVMGDLPGKCKDVFQKNDLIVTGDLPRWKNVTYLAKRLGKWSPDRIRLTNGASWLQGWFPHFFEIFLPAGFISFFSHSRI